MRKIIYSIQGNIGSGKSTLLRSLIKSMKPIIPIPEPVENWQSVAGYNLLDKYYQDPARWGYTFQVNCILSRMTQLSQSFQTMTPDKVYVSERSVQADKFIFARLMHKLNKMTDMEYQLYLQMFESLENLFNKHAFVKNTNIERFPLMGQPQNYFFQNQKKEQVSVNKPESPIVYRHIYLKTSAQKCFQRIKKRNRQQEKKLQFDYIKELDQLHDNWLIEGRDKSSLILDGQREFETDKDYLNQLILQIKSYIIENSNIQDVEYFGSSQQSKHEVQTGRKVAEQSFAK